MNRTRTILYIILLAVTVARQAPARGQATDSLSATRSLLKEGQFKKAEQIVSAYAKNHPADFNTTWLYAYTSYFAGNYKRSEQLYESASGQAPGNYYLKLDYARMLVNTGKYERAENLLREYLAYDTAGSLANLLMAQAYYYRSDFAHALDWLHKVASTSEEYAYAVQLESEIITAASPWISVTSAYTSDDQPLSSLTPELKAGWQAGAYLKPHFRASLPVFSLPGGKSSFAQAEIGNQLYFAGPRIKTGIAAGIVRSNDGGKTDWTGSFSLQKSLLQKLVFEASTGRSPYYYTLAAAGSSIMENSASVSLSRPDFSSWNGSITVGIKQYPVDGNRVTYASAWAFAPPLKLSPLELRAGLAYGYSTSDINRFEPAKSLADIVSAFDSALQIKGIYSPYFTPQNQQVLSALASASLQAGAKWNFSASGSLGVYSHLDVPYFYLASDAGNSLFIAKDFVRLHYFPLELNAGAGYSPSGTLTLGAKYQLSRTYYYTRHYVEFSLKIILSHAGRR